MDRLETIAPSLPSNRSGGKPNSKKKIMTELSTNNFSNTRNGSSVDNHPLNEFEKNSHKLDTIDIPRSFRHDNNNIEKPREWTLVNCDYSNTIRNVFDSSNGSVSESSNAMNIVVETNNSHCWRREQGRTRSSSSSIASSITEDVGGGVGIGIGSDDNTDVPNGYYYNEETTSSNHMNANLPPPYHQDEKSNESNNIAVLKNDDKKNHSSNHCHSYIHNHSKQHHNNHNSSSSTLCSDDAFSYTIMNLSSHLPVSSFRY